MAGSTYFKVTHTCPSCRETVVHECGKGAAPRAEGLDVERVEQAIRAATFSWASTGPHWARAAAKAIVDADARLSRPPDDPEEAT